MTHHILAVLLVLTVPTVLSTPLESTSAPSPPSPTPPSSDFHNEQHCTHLTRPWFGVTAGSVRRVVMENCFFVQCGKGAGLAVGVNMTEGVQVVARGSVVAPSGAVVAGPKQYQSVDGAFEIHVSKETVVLDMAWGCSETPIATHAELSELVQTQSETHHALLAIMLATALGVNLLSAAIGWLLLVIWKRNAAGRAPVEGVAKIL